MKKSRKKLKGMTLIEMIISIAIFAIMGGLLVLVGTHIDNTTKATNNLKNKIVVESPYAANHITNKEGGGTLGKTPLTITIEQDQASGTFYYPEVNAKGETELKQGQYNKGDKVVLDCEKYETESIITDQFKTPEEVDAYKKRANGDLNLEFVEIVPATTAPAGP